MSSNAVDTFLDVEVAFAPIFYRVCMAIASPSTASDLSLFKLKPQQVLIDRLDSRETALRENEAGEDLREQMNAIYQARNLTRLMLSGIQLEEERLIALADDSLVDVEPLGVEPDLIDGLGKRLFQSGGAKKGEHVIITGAKRNIEVLEAVARECMANGVTFDLDIVNDELEAAIINHADDNGLRRVADNKLVQYGKSNIKIEARSNSEADFDSVRQRFYNSLLTPYTSRLRSGQMHYSLTIIPTPKDAELDGMDYDDYMELFFEACDQPWDAIDSAQAKLAEKFDVATEIRIVNDDGTDLEMSIDGHTFANSVVLKNIPGSEIFSAPVLRSVNGRLVAKGNFKYGNSPIISDIELVFENGKVVSYSASQGEEALAQILAADDGNGDGSRCLGELGIGTNPHLRKHMVNALLVEKIGGSFHVALGSAYNMPVYRGKEVNLDNGNRSNAGTHWDITTMLKGRGGKMSLDGEIIQEDGIWVDSDGQPDTDLAVLNYGWGAMPESERPDWWKERYANGYEV